MDRALIKKQEQANLSQIYKTNPELFKGASTLEDPKFLRNFGITIPGKEYFPKGYLKLYPSDFIVEEISNNGTISTIEWPSQLSTITPRDPKNDSHRATFATLVKCNISTLEVVEEMSKQLECSPDSIRYAGLKDKNAITAQALSFHGIDPEKLQKLSSSHYFLKDFRWGKGSVEKGGLKGNRFTIFVRSPQKIDGDTFTKQTSELETKGFYNFYYLQRFGVPRMVNYQWGFDILRGRYKETVLGYLTDSNSRELPYFQELRKQIKSLIPDWKKIKTLVSPYPLMLFNENKIVDYLIDHPDDYLGTLKDIRDQIMLWTYGFGSLLFNESISAYLQTNQSVPEKIPLLLSDQTEDIEFYSHLLKAIKYYPPQFNNLRPFANIRLQRRLVSCIEKIKIDRVAFSNNPEGVALQFTLPKGQYATTLLSHLFNIISGVAPDEIPGDRADVARTLELPSLEKTWNYFAKINTSKKDFSFDDLE